MNNFEVGKPVCSPSEDGIIFDLDDSGATLLYKMASPTQREIKSMAGSAEFRYIKINDIIFFLSRFGYLEWMDAPYHRSLSLSLTKTMTIENGMGLSLHMLLIDAKTGILLYQRLIGLGTDFSVALVDDIEQQKEIAILDYHNRINQIYAQYTTGQMVAMAKYSYKITRAGGI